jgi:DNA-binding NtrC family response regulator
MSVDQEPETRPVRFKKVLVIDQDEAWALVMRDAVARGGFCVALSTSIDETVRTIRGQTPDLLLISCLLDVEAGENLLREIDNLKEAPPVVLVGLKDGDDRWEPWRPRPYVTIVRQPFKLHDVLEAVRTLLDTAWVEITDEASSGSASGAPKNKTEGRPGAHEGGSPS